jgi:biopolymer transport protein ExbD
MIFIAATACGLGWYVGQLPRVITIDLRGDGTIEFSGRTLVPAQLPAAVNSWRANAAVVRVSPQVAHSRLQELINSICASGIRDIKLQPRSETPQPLATLAP